jgi:transposase-like protein
MILKLTSPRGPSITELAAKAGVAESTLSRWLREATTVRRTMSDEQQNSGRPLRARRPEDVSPEDKLRILREAARLDGPELGAFLRREGVHEADLERWRSTVEEAGLAALAGRRQRSAEQKRVRKLESELRRKDKALAEAAALLVLEKKVQALWGDREDDDTSGSNEE